MAADDGIVDKPPPPGEPQDPPGGAMQEAGQVAAGDSSPQATRLHRRLAMASRGELGQAGLQWSAATVALRDVMEPALAAAARAILPANLGVHLVDVCHCSYRRFSHNVQEPTCRYVLLASPPVEAGADGDRQAPPRRIDLEFAPEIAWAIIDMLLGGPAGAAAPKVAPLTTIERRVLRSMAEVVAECLSRSCGLRSADYVRVVGEADAGQATAADDERAVLLTFRLTCRGADGAMRICMPADVLDEILAAPSAGASCQAAIELTAILPDASLSAEQAEALLPGDIVVTDTPPDGEVTIRLAGVAKFAGRLGVCNGRRAVTITRRLEPPQSN